VLNPELGDWLCRFFAKFRAKNCILNPKLGDWEDVHISWEVENRHRFER
jgi:hypothetical protein